MGIYSKHNEDLSDTFLNEEDNIEEVEDKEEIEAPIVKSSKLIELNSVLRLYCSNFRNLHWNSKGEEFDDAHATISNGYISLCDKYVDSTGEMITRLDMNPLNYTEVVEFINNAENNYMVINTEKLYTRKEIIEYSGKMLEDIVNLIVAVLNEAIIGETINAGIKSDLEAMLNEFDIQYRYINKRRMTE